MHLVDMRSGVISQAPPIRNCQKGSMWEGIRMMRPSIYCTSSSHPQKVHNLLYMSLPHRMMEEERWARVDGSTSPATPSPPPLPITLPHSASSLSLSSQALTRCVRHPPPCLHSLPPSSHTLSQSAKQWVHSRVGWMECL